MDTERQNNTTTIILIVLGVALVATLCAIVILILLFVFRGSSDSGDIGALPPPGVTIEATIIAPTPEVGEPTATVIAPLGVNVRVGPGTEYPILGLAPQGTVLEIVGVSQDDTWWVIQAPGAPNDQGWVSAEFVQAENVESVPVIQPPPTPTPATPPTPTATPAPEVTFTASRTVINAGETATLSWQVENVKAVYMYPVGDGFENYPVTGQGSRDVQPYITTSYELLVFNPDDTTSAQRIEITVVGGLTSSRWLLQSYSTPGGGLQTLLPGSQITARFGADGSLSGSAGCNTYSGAFTAFDQTLRTTALTASRAFCESPAGVMEQEGTFLSLMEQAANFSISAGQLSVFDNSGNRILAFNSG